MEKGRDIQIKVIWEQMKAGDEQSLSEIFTIYYSDLYHYGIKIFNLPDLVRDSIQDVFVRLWEKRRTIGEVQNPKAYLISSVRRKLLANKESDHSHLLDQLTERTEAFSFSAFEFAEAREVSQQLMQSLVRAVNGLPERQRELIFLRFYYSLRYQEIARIMEVNEQTVRNLMQRALANLRTRVDRRLWEDMDNLDNLLLILFLNFSKIS